MTQKVEEAQGDRMGRVIEILMRIINPQEQLHCLAHTGTPFSGTCEISGYFKGAQTTQFVLLFVLF